MLRKLILAGILSALMVGGLVVTIKTAAVGSRESANGHGALINDDGSKRQFTFSAQRMPNGSVKGQATLHNPAFTGANGQKYQLQLDITCMKVYGNIAVFGGLTRRTNDPNLVDAAFFSVQDNGEPGNGVDTISRVFFWDDDPNTTGDPQACQLIGPADFPLETIETGNIQVKP